MLNTLLHKTEIITTERLSPRLRYKFLTFRGLSTMFYRVLSRRGPTAATSITMIFARKLLVHLLFLFFDRSVGGALGVSGDERRLLLRHTRLTLLDRQALRGPSLNLDFLGRLGSPQRISPDGGVGIAIHLLHTIRSDPVLQEGAELLLIRLLVILQQRLHVLGDVLSENVSLVHLGIVLFGLSVVTGEALVAVRDVYSAINGALERAEDLGAGGRAGEADVEVGAEGAVLSVDVLHAEILAVGLCLPFVDLVDAVLGEFVSVSGLNDHVSINTGVRYLADDVLV